MKAADLRHDEKQEVLGKVRTMVGSGEYDKLVNSLGEDGVIDAVLSAHDQPVQTRQKPLISALFLIAYGLFMFIIPAGHGFGPWGYVLGFVLFVFFLYSNRR